MFEIANSKFEWSDHQMQTKSMDIHDETLLYGYSQGDLIVEIGISFACNSIPLNHKTYKVGCDGELRNLVPSIIHTF